MERTERLAVCGDARHDCCANVCGSCVALTDTSDSSKGCKFYRNRDEMTDKEWAEYQVYRRTN